MEEFKNAAKEGDVKVIYDKTIAKHTIVIGGATSASNYIAIPANKNGAKQSLDLTGKFVSIIDGANSTFSLLLITHFIFAYCRSIYSYVPKLIKTSSCTSNTW